MKKTKFINKIIALSLSLMMILQFSGCRSISMIPGSELPYAEKNYYYIHSADSSYTVTATRLTDGMLTGIISHPLEKPSKGNVMHLYIAPDSAITITGTDISVPAANVAKAEIYRVDAGKTVTVAAGAAIGTFWASAIILWIVKGLSCPFVYSEDGNEVNLEGEIYSGASSIPIERDDYLRLKTLSPVDDRYRIRITNEVKEIQNTNLAELWVFDHPAECEVIVDKYGTAYSISDLRRPVTATDACGRQILSELSSADRERYLSTVRNDDLTFDTISLSFEKPANCREGKLVISGKNTMWLDYMFGQLSDLFGRKHDAWKERRNRRSREDLIKWTLDQGIVLSVFIGKDDGYEFVDYFNVPGPIADKRDVLKLDLSGISGDTVNIKLVAGILFWELDFAGMDFSPEMTTVKTVVPPGKATDQSGNEITSLIMFDDDRYLVQPDIGNEALVTFTVPPMAEGTARTVFLHSRGNYEVLRDARGKPDMEELKKMLQPGMFTLFAKEHFLKHYAAGH
jgi:hypothetical protein